MEITYIKRKKINFIQSNSTTIIKKPPLFEKCIWYTVHIFLNQCNFTVI